MTDPIVGIDLGTTNSVVAVAEEGGDCRVLADESGYKVQPSVVSFHPDGSVLVGADAKQRRVIDPNNTVYSVKRLIGRSFRSREVAEATTRATYGIVEGVGAAPAVTTRAGQFAIPEISAIVLDHMRNIARRALGTEVKRTVVTVPANFTDAQRSATATAGAIAGLTIVRVLNEPTAAALAYGHRRKLNETIAVYDFGGGTFDVTILKLTDSVFEVLGTAGDSFLGGDDLDERLVDHMVAVFLERERVDLRANDSAMQRLRQVAEQTKIQLSRRSRAVIKIDEIAYGPGGKPLDFELEITRDELVSRVSDIVDRTFPVCEEAVSVAGVRPEDIDDIVLVGGTTKMPLVRDRVARFFGKSPRNDINPDEAVAIGAGLQGVALGRILGARRQTARSHVAPPAPPMESRSAGPPPIPRPPTRTTAPRFGTAEPTEVEDFDEEYTTGVHERDHFRRDVAAPQPPPIPTERPARPGGHHDQLPGQPRSDGSALARITRPRTPPPAPKPSIGRKTTFGRAAGPGAASPPEPSVSFKNVSTDASTQVRDDRPGPEQPLDLGGIGLGPEPAAGAGPIAPRVVDVTPHSLGIATVAGYCEELIGRNARVPTQMKRTFSTSKDEQRLVRIRVCQGESRRIDDNVVLGDLVLDGLEARPRGQTRIEVTFVVDESGILRVRARDADSGREQRADLDTQGRQSAAEVEAARQRIAGLRR